MNLIINLSIEQLTLFKFYSNYLAVYQNCLQPIYKLMAKLIQKYLFIYEHRFIQDFKQNETQQYFYHYSLWTIILLFSFLNLKKVFFLKVIFKYLFIQDFIQIETQKYFYHYSLWMIIFSFLNLKKGFFLKMFFNLQIQM